MSQGAALITGASKSIPDVPKIGQVGSPAELLVHRPDLIVA